MSITVTIVDDEGLESEVEFPSKKEVCPECDGEGFVLCDGMRGHAYSREEFEESFCDDEDREAYFTRGGKYDVQCPCCKGKNVIDVVDESRIASEQKEQFQEYQKQERQKAQWDREDRMTMRMECGGFN